MTVPTGPHHCRSNSIDDAAAEHGGDHGCEIAEPASSRSIARSGPASVRMPIISENSTSATSALISAFLKMNATPGAREAGVRTRVCHAGARQTFSTSGRPSRPVGRKISTMIRIEKAATSLYSTEK